MHIINKIYVYKIKFYTKISIINIDKIFKNCPIISADMERPRGRNKSQANFINKSLK